MKLHSTDTALEIQLIPHHLNIGLSAVKRHSRYNLYRIVIYTSSSQYGTLSTETALETCKTYAAYIPLHVSMGLETVPPYNLSTGLETVPPYHLNTGLETVRYIPYHFNTRLETVLPYHINMGLETVLPYHLNMGLATLKPFWCHNL